MQKSNKLDSNIEKRILDLKDIKNEIASHKETIKLVKCTTPEYYKERRDIENKIIKQINESVINKIIEYVKIDNKDAHKAEKKMQITTEILFMLDCIQDINISHTKTYIPKSFNVRGLLENSGSTYDIVLVHTLNDDLYKIRAAINNETNHTQDNDTIIKAFNHLAIKPLKPWQEFTERGGAKSVAKKLMDGLNTNTLARDYGEKALFAEEKQEKQRFLEEEKQEKQRFLEEEKECKNEQKQLRKEQKQLRNEQKHKDRCR
jgi:hypothetical protein